MLLLTLSMGSGLLLLRAELTGLCAPSAVGSERRNRLLLAPFPMHIQYTATTACQAVPTCSPSLAAHESQTLVNKVWSRRSKHIPELTTQKNNFFHLEKGPRLEREKRLSRFIHSISEEQEGRPRTRRAAAAIKVIALLLTEDLRVLSRSECNQRATAFIIVDEMKE
jgi:hypothetical protein